MGLITGTPHRSGRVTHTKKIDLAIRLNMYFVLIWEKQTNFATLFSFSMCYVTRPQMSTFRYTHGNHKVCRTWDTGPLRVLRSLYRCWVWSWVGHSPPIRRHGTPRLNVNSTLLMYIFIIIHVYVKFIWWRWATMIPVDAKFCECI